jgi:acid phosphatase type 7
VHAAVGDAAPDTGAVLRYFQDEKWGFLTLTIDRDKITGVGTEVDRGGNVTKGDEFEYPTAPVRLADPKSVPTL